jgi:hypothetical protein
MLVIFVLLFSLCTALSASAAGASSRIAVNESDIDVPTWEVGDTWVMGLEERITDEELKAELTPDEKLIFNYITLNLDISTGIYESLKVLEKDVTVNEEKCYRTEFEAAFI